MPSKVSTTKKRGSLRKKRSSRFLKKLGTQNVSPEDLAQSKLVTDAMIDRVEQKQAVDQIRLARQAAVRTKINTRIDRLVMLLAVVTSLMGVALLGYVWTSYNEDTRTFEDGSNVLVFNVLISICAFASTVIMGALYSCYTRYTHYHLNVDPTWQKTCAALPFTCYVEVVVCLLHLPPYLVDAEYNYLQVITLLRCYQLLKLVRFHPSQMKRKFMIEKARLVPMQGGVAHLKSSFNADPWGVIFLLMLLFIPALSWSLYITERPYSEDLDNFGIVLYLALITFTTLDFGIDYRAVSPAGMVISFFGAILAVCITTLLLTAFINTLELDEQMRSLENEAMKAGLKYSMERQAGEIVLHSFRGVKQRNSADEVGRVKWRKELHQKLKQFKIVREEVKPPPVTSREQQEQQAKQGNLLFQTVRSTQSSIKELGQQAKSLHTKKTAQTQSTHSKQMSELAAVSRQQMLAIQNLIEQQRANHEENVAQNKSFRNQLKLLGNKVDKRSFG